MTKPDSNLSREDVSVSQSRGSSQDLSPATGVKLEAERAAALASLLARVEAATGGDREMDVRIQWTLNGSAFTDEEVAASALIRVDRDTGEESRACDGWTPEYSASLDAALALVERVLGDRWYCDVDHVGDNAFVSFLRHYPNSSGPDRIVEGRADTRPLAVCAALLHALIADTASPAHGRSQTEDEQP